MNELESERRMIELSVEYFNRSLSPTINDVNHCIKLNIVINFDGGIITF